MFPRLLFVILSLVVASCVSAQPSAAGEPSVFIEVQDRSGMFDDVPLGTLYLACSATGWDVKGVWSFGHLAPTSREAGGWMFSVPRSLIEKAGEEFEFKFTRGSWETVEVDADGRDIPNRTLPAIDWDVQPNPAFTLVVHGFVDQRGTRWSMKESERASTVVGKLDIHEVTSEVLGNTRKVRVWLPPAYMERGMELVRYPVLYMHDGQNLFDEATSFSGEWRVDETLLKLMADGFVPGVIVVGIDNAGDARMEEYTPLPIGPMRPGRGGRGDEYVSFLVDELMPRINAMYRTRTGPRNTALGGSSLGGIITLHAAMTRPNVFGAILVESPSFWVAEGAILDRVKERDVWPQRVFMAMGTKEYGDEQRDAVLIETLRQAAAAMQAKGLDDSRLYVIEGKGDVHHESAWARRLPEALRFLLSPMFQEE